MIVGLAFSGYRQRAQYRIRSPSADVDAGRPHELLGSLGGVLGEVEHVGRRDGLGSADHAAVDQVLPGERAPTFDDPDRHRLHDVTYEIEIVALAAAFPVDRRQEDLAGAAALGLAGPITRDPSRRLPSPVNPDLGRAVRLPAHVD